MFLWNLSDGRCKHNLVQRKSPPLNAWMMIHYPDGTVVENAFSNEITRIILPDGNTLKPGEFHQVSENHAIDSPVTDEPW